MRRSLYSRAKPFLKWAGGKTQLLPEIERRIQVVLGAQKIAYVEPFVGGGAVLFWLLQRYPNIECAVINDLNERLINVYRCVRDNPHALIETLQVIEREYLALDHEDRAAYYMAKRGSFNRGTLAGVKQAALFIFLNRTCFNGLYRENSKGEFNVPHGRYANPQICEEATIIADSHVLQRVEILCGDFAATGKYAGQNTLYYLDPPYKPLSETSSFNSYVKEPFGDTEQVRLRDFCHAIARSGSLFILSNSDVKGASSGDDFFDDLYSAFQIQRVQAMRMVNANPEKRGKLTELMITNIQPDGANPLEPGAVEGFT